MSTDRGCMTARDARGAKIRVGDRVTAISQYDGSTMNTGTVVKIWRQGADGTILQMDAPPNPQYTHHFSHRASLTIKVTLSPADKTLHERLRMLHCISCYDVIKDQSKQSPCPCTCHKPKPTP